MLVQILFYTLAAMAISSAIMVVLVRNPVRAVFSLILTFATTAALWLLLEVEFLAWGLILIYVGAVMVLFLFIVMMLNIDTATIKSSFTKFLPLGIGIPLLLIIMLVYSLELKDPTFRNITSPVLRAADYSNVKELATVLFSEYLIHFELAGMLLLAALVAAIAINSKFKNKRTPKPSWQVKANKEERLTLVDLPRNN